MHRSPERGEFETTLQELVHAIHDVTSSDAEACAVLQSMLAGGRISSRAAMPGCATFADGGLQGRALQLSTHHPIAVESRRNPLAVADVASALRH